MLNKSMTTGTVLLLSMALLPVAAATRDVDERLKVGEGASVSIELIDGQVRLIGWNRSEVHIEGVVEVFGRHDDDSSDESIEISSDGRDVEIEIELPHDGHYRGHSLTDLTIHLPHDAEIEVETISAGVVIEGARGIVGVESVSGEITISGMPTELSVESVAAEVEVDCSGILESGEFESVSGNMDLRLKLGRDSRISTSSVNGDIVLRLPPDTSADFSFETFNGSIENEFGPRARKTSDFLPSLSLEFQTGSGGARVVGECFNGRIKLLKE